MVEKFWTIFRDMGGGIMILIAVLLVAVCIVAVRRLKAPKESRKDDSNPAGEP